MKFKSHVFAQTSGSVAGLTYSHNKGGMYTRARSTPTNPNTGNQQRVRAAVKTLTARWSQVLTVAQRTDWATYAANVPLLNKLGEPRPIPALAMYVRCNAPRMNSLGAASIIDNGPTIFALSTLTEPTITKVGFNWHMAYDNTDPWANDVGGYMFAYTSLPQNQTINFFKGPFNLVATVVGDLTTPPTSPLIFGPPNPIQTGVRYFFRYNATTADGRLSSSFINFVDT